MSPRYFTALVKRHREIRKAEAERADYRAGVVAAAVINSQGGWKEDESAQPADFFPWLEETLGKAGSGNDVEAFIAALKERGAVDRRKR